MPARRSGSPRDYAHLREWVRPLRGSVCGYLDDLYVAPSVRGTGAVEALYAEMHRIAHERGWAIIRWTTADDNYRARSVYDKVSDAHDLDHLRHDTVSTQRYAARVLLLDEAGRVLLFAGRPAPARGRHVVVHAGRRTRRGRDRRGRGAAQRCARRPAW